jgi:hypothetical protein
VLNIVLKKKKKEKNSPFYIFIVLKILRLNQGLVQSFSNGIQISVIKNNTPLEPAIECVTVRYKNQLYPKFKNPLDQFSQNYCALQQLESYITVI